MDKCLPALKPAQLAEFQDGLLTDHRCTQRMADYLVNSDTFTLDEVLNEAFS